MISNIQTASMLNYFFRSLLSQYIIPNVSKLISLLRIHLPLKNPFMFNADLFYKRQTCLFRSNLIVILVILIFNPVTNNNASSRAI